MWKDWNCRIIDQWGSSNYTLMGLSNDKHLRRFILSFIPDTGPGAVTRIEKDLRLFGLPSLNPEETASIKGIMRYAAAHQAASKHGTTGPERERGPIWESWPNAVEMMETKLRQRRLRARSKAEVDSVRELVERAGVLAVFPFFDALETTYEAAWAEGETVDEPARAAVLAKVVEAAAAMSLPGPLVIQGAGSESISKRAHRRREQLVAWAHDYMDEPTFRGTYKALLNQVLSECTAAARIALGLPVNAAAGSGSVRRRGGLRSRIGSDTRGGTEALVRNARPSSGEFEDDDSAVQPPAAKRARAGGLGEDQGDGAEHAAQALSSQSGKSLHVIRFLASDSAGDDDVNAQFKLEDPLVRANLKRSLAKSRAPRGDVPTAVLAVRKKAPVENSCADVLTNVER